MNIDYWRLNSQLFINQICLCGTHRLNIVCQHSNIYCKNDNQRPKNQNIRIYRACASLLYVIGDINSVLNDAIKISILLLNIMISIFYQQDYYRNIPIRI